MRVKQPLLLMCITALVGMATIGWLVNASDDPIRNPRIRESILLRCASDLAHAWTQDGTIDRPGIRRVLSITSSQSERYMISWGLDHVGGRSPFARVTIENRDQVTRVFIIDLVNGKTEANRKQIGTVTYFRPPIASTPATSRRLPLRGSDPGC